MITSRDDAPADYWAPTDDDVRETVLRRIESSFRDVYVGLLSIIQGVAFGFLAAVVAGSPAPHPLHVWLRIGLCAALILIVWQEYTVGATVFAWTPTLLDTLVPYGIGALEFAAINAISASLRTFLVISTLVWCAGIAAYGNLWYHACHGFPSNKFSYQVFGRYVRFGFTVSVVGTAGNLLVIVTLNEGLWPDSPLPPTIAVLIPYAVLALHSIWDWTVPLQSIKRRR